MPQMAPINWIFLFLLFTLIFLMINSFTYYLYTPTIKTSKTFKSSHNTLNWKW